MKRCITCGEEKSEAEFYRRGPGGDLRGQCKVCQRAYKRDWTDRHPGASTRYEQNYEVRHPEKAASARKRINKNAREKFIEKHGCTPHRYYAHRTSGYELLFEQGWSCAICKAPIFSMLDRHVHIDHCHTSGLTRGVLCRDCNLMIGFAKDNVVILQNAIEYLTSTGAVK